MPTIKDDLSMGLALRVAPAYSIAEFNLSNWIYWNGNCSRVTDLELCAPKDCATFLEYVSKSERIILECIILYKMMKWKYFVHNSWFKNWVKRRNSEVLNLNFSKDRLDFCPNFLEDSFFYFYNLLVNLMKRKRFNKEFLRIRSPKISYNYR